MRLILAVTGFLLIAVAVAACHPPEPVTSFSPATGSDGGSGGGGGGSM
jgi:hypothetical protein